MKWLRRGLTALVLLAILASLTALGVLYYSYSYILTPPVTDPEKPLLAWEPVPANKPSLPAPWLQVARTDQNAPIDLEAFNNPGLAFGPWTRWWWPGNLVEAKELKRELQLFADVGIAGVEIQPFAISLSPTDKALPQWQIEGWDSPSFYANLHTVLDRAAELHLGVDLNNGSGWPTGGPHVALEDGMRQLLHSELLVTGPKQLDTTAPSPRMPITTFAAGVVGMVGDTPMQTFATQQRELVAVIAAPVTSNKRSLLPWDFLDQVDIEQTSAVDITHAVNNGRLFWEVPPGGWVVVFLWQLPGGELISGGYAHPQPGYVVDHLDAQRMRANQNYLYREETGLQRYFGSPLRAFFNDSLEFRQERHWARDHLQNFQQRYGYDPRPFLPALIQPGKDQMPFHALNILTLPEYETGETGQRFREDWERLTSDLFRQRYLATMQEWGSTRQFAHRLQAYGGPIDVISAAGESDIPETEQLYAGGSEMFLKTVSSGAQIADKPLVSAEAFISVGRAFMTTPLKIKALADKAFAAGINQLIYHGSSYQIPDAAERGYPARDGWFPWQLGLISTDFSERWNFWQYAPELNRYIARNQYLLRKGRMEADVLLLYPGVGFPQGYDNPLEPFNQGAFPGEQALQPEADTAPASSVEQMRSIWRAARTLESQGLSWAWVNEEKLQSAKFSGGHFQVGDLTARALLLQDIDAITAQTANKLTQLSALGLPIIVNGSRPDRAIGLVERHTNDDIVKRAIAALPNDQALPVPIVAYQNNVVRTQRRRLTNDDVLQFFSNPGADPVQLKLQVRDAYPQLAWLDAWTGEANAARLERDSTVTYELPAYGSVYLWLSNTPTTLQPLPKAQTARQWLVTDWSLQVDGEWVQTAGALPGDWLNNENLRESGGPGTYIARINVDGDLYQRPQRESTLQLSLGELFGAADIYVNGEFVSSALVPPYTVDIGTLVQSGDNTLKVVLHVARKNRLVEPISENAPGWTAPSLIGTSARVSAGLIGPVTVTERVIDAPHTIAQRPQDYSGY